MTVINPAIQSYVTEAQDLLAQLESMLLDLETLQHAEEVDAVFRALHTLKGGGGMFGFPELSAFVHHFEDAFDLVRQGKIGVSAPLIEASLQGRDHMIALLEAGGDASRTAALAGSPAAMTILDGLRRAMDSAAPPKALPVRNWQIRFRPDAMALRNGMRPDLILQELASLGQSQLVADTSSVPPLAEIDPTLSCLGWVVTLATTESRDAIASVFLFAEDAELDIAELPPVAIAAPIAEVAPPPVASTIAASPPRPVSGEVAPGTDRGGAGSRRNARGNDPALDSVRVPSGKLDAILDQLGELVIAQARLGQVAARVSDSILSGLVEEIQRLVTGLRDTTLAVRMLPIETVFGKFRRVVRDLSVELGKDIELDAEGGETEIDKNVLDRLSEPLVHMIRNAVDHGIEDASARQAAGKPQMGRVSLTARQEAGEIVITVSDDGRGLDHGRIRAKAVERGLIDAASVLGDDDLAQMIFAPGFSTAQKVTSVSGRGVGMDAVMTAITALRGSVSVHSRAGEGTRVTLRLPLTLAIIDGLLVRLGADVFVLPLNAVEECVEFDPVELSRDSGRSMLQIRELLVPFVDLCRVFGTPASTELRRRVVIVRSENERLGLVVDDIIGQHQTVIKTMSPFHAELECFSGATILGDGGVALIVDVSALIRRQTVPSSQPTALAA